MAGLVYTDTNEIVFRNSMDQALQPQIQLSIPSLEDSLRLGQSLHIEFEGMPALSGGYNLWGICPNQTIMVSAPQLEITEQLLNTPVKVRLFIEHLDSACAFRTSVADLCASPSPYLHLAMPNSMVTGEVRRNNRANIRLPCELRYTDSRVVDPTDITTNITKCIIHAEMVDASTCGCRIDTTANDLKVGDTVSMTFEIRIYGIDQAIDLTAMIRSRSETEAGYSLGAQFLEMKDYHRIALNSYLLKHC
jgi:hypothetical protein